MAGKAVGGELPGRLAAAQLDPLGAHGGGEARNEGFGDVLVDEQGLHGIAHAGALHLGVQGDLLGFGKVGAGIDEDVTDPLVVFDHRNPRMLGDETDQPLTAAGDDQVDLLLALEQFQDGGAVGGLDHLQGRWPAGRGVPVR